MKRPRRGVWAFLRRHERAEGAIAEALTIDVVWALLRQFVFGAAVAGAATFAALELQTSRPYHPPVALSVKGAAFLTREEGVRYQPYNDPYNCTVGVGHLIHYGYCTGAELRLRYTQAQVSTLLIHDATWAANCVHSSVTRKLVPPQGDALVSLTFNIGCGGLQKSSLLRDVNTGDSRALAAVWPNFYVTANGRYLAGLHTRREAESHLYLTGDYGAGIGRYVPPKPVNPRKVPRPVPKWAWKLAAWRLERYPYRSCKRRLSCRPRSAPAKAPPWFWVFLHRFNKGVK